MTSIWRAYTRRLATRRFMRRGPQDASWGTRRRSRMHSASAEAQAQLETLTRLSTEDLIDAFGFGNVRHGRSLLERLCYGPAHRFARQVILYDAIVGAHGL